ncbi:MAG TPA: tRNA(His) guanylyltransferase Thg1 family protein [Gemmataceae bacterium]|nr:tRNA(His) guanylyltransferase Thg1 family protein [Gemmataceae bacterium]
MSDSLGDRMKTYETAEAGSTLMPLLPALARLDGRGFSAFTRGLERPFDKRLSGLMVETTTFLVKETNAVCGYTQSDEISLGWVAPSFDSQIFFAGRVQKMNSVLAALCSVYFNGRLREVMPPEYAARTPVFDCRVWNVPTLDEAANVLLWRELDAWKNSVAMAARHYYPHEEIQAKSCAEMHELLWKKGCELE